MNFNPKGAPFRLGKVRKITLGRGLEKLFLLNPSTGNDALT